MANPFVKLREAVGEYIKGSPVNIIRLNNNYTITEGAMNTVPAASEQYRGVEFRTEATGGDAWSKVLLGPSGQYAHYYPMLSVLGNAAASDNALTLIANGMGSAIGIGVVGDLYVPYPARIEAAVAMADQDGDIACDVWATTDLSTPTADDSIVGTSPITITSSSFSMNTTLADWDTDIAAGTRLRFNIENVVTITRCTFVLVVAR